MQTSLLSSRAPHERRGCVLRQIVIPDVLSAEEIDQLNADYDRFHPSLGNPPQERVACTDRHGNTYEGQRFWSKAYADLADHPTIVPILEELLGDPRWGHAHQCLPEELRPKFRLDHHNIHYRAPLSAEEGAEAYKNGAPHLHGGAENCRRRPLFGRSLSYPC